MYSPFPEFGRVVFAPIQFTSSGKEFLGGFYCLHFDMSKFKCESPPYRRKSPFLPGKGLFVTARSFYSQSLQHIILRSPPPFTHSAAFVCPPLARFGSDLAVKKLVCRDYLLVTFSFLSLADSRFDEPFAFFFPSWPYSPPVLRPRGALVLRRVSFFFLATYRCTFVSFFRVALPLS